MEDFEIFQKVLIEFEQVKDSSVNTPNLSSKKNSSDSDDPEEVCGHFQIIDDNGVKICSDCGMEINREINYDKEWRYYGASDSRHSSDPNRCHARKLEEKTIFKDVENMGFSEKIVAKANDIYGQVTKGKIYRGNSRKAIVFACIFHSYKLAGNPQSCDMLRNAFNLHRKIGLKGLKRVNLGVPKTSGIRTCYITPLELIGEILDKFNATQRHKEDVAKLYEKIRNKSTIINRARPQSVASALVYYYICSKNKEIGMKDFTQKVGLSELTISKIVKEIQRIMETE